MDNFELALRKNTRRLSTKALPPAVSHRIKDYPKLIDFKTSRKKFMSQRFSIDIMKSLGLKTM